MDGEIWVESIVNEGSQFMFTVKTRIIKNISSLMLHDRMKPFVGRTILCVGLGVAPQDLRTIQGLGMVPVVFKYVQEINNKSVVPNVEAIIVDAIDAVSSLPRAPPLPCLGSHGCGLISR
jgi:osomolarity two-component system sensor histidine kinase NIK1